MTESLFDKPAQPDGIACEAFPESAMPYRLDVVRDGKFFRRFAYRTEAERDRWAESYRKDGIIEPDFLLGRIYNGKV